jgi:phosphate transport system protein
MFTFIKELFSSDSLVNKAYNDTNEMLRVDFEMFKESVRSLRQSDSDKLRIDIYSMDKKINKYEREVRRNVVAHLAVTGAQNAVPGLVLISIVIDVERIGDYTKNIAELAQAHAKRLDGLKYEEKLLEIEKKITDKFEKVALAYQSSDEDVARRLMDEHGAISSWCDQAVTELVKTPPAEITTGHAVALAIYIRYLKRISAHLTNIVSAVVNPFPRIGFRRKN